MAGCKYKEQSYEEVSVHLKSDILLIVTATDIETSETHKKLNPFPGHSEILKVFKGSQTYYFGLFGSYKAIHVQCSMGSTSRASSILTVTEALTIIKPVIVLMPGIAFGINSGDQKIGDVIVAETIYPYNNKRVGKEIIHRGTPLNASKILINRFKSIKTNWEYLITSGTKASLIIAPILSGEELIDNMEYRDQLVESFPTVKGGEMEGGGLYAACDGNVDFILVKGICDFADGNKSVDKEQNQILAINSALSACLEVFSSKTAFEGVGLKSFAQNVEYREAKEYDANNLLFDIYDEEKEVYYIPREVDSELIRLIPQYGVWIYGIPGCGKSNYIIRNLIQNKIEYIYISLASSVGSPIDSYFEEIYYDLVSKYETESSLIKPRSFSDCTKSILKLLEKKFKSKNLVVFIEEIPISNDDQEKEFTEKVFSLIINKSLIAGLGGVKFFLSSINNPQSNIKTFNQKIHTILKFKELTNWENKDLNALIDLILSYINIPFEDKVREVLIGKAKGSPRFIKKYFRNILSEGKSDEASLFAMVIKTEIELSQI